MGRRSKPAILPSVVHSAASSPVCAALCLCVLALLSIAAQPVQAQKESEAEKALIEIGRAHV